MPVICFPNCGFLSETSRMVAIYRKLQEIGVPAKMVTHGGIFEFVFEQEKIPYEKIEPYVSERDCQRYLKVMSKPWVNFYDKSTLHKMVKYEIEFFKDVNASAVVTGFQISLALSARSINLPLIVPHIFVPPVFEKGMFCSEILDNPITRLIPEEKLNRFMFKLFLSFPFQKRVFNKVADHLNIERVRSIVELMMGDLTLVTDVPEILQITDEEMEAWRPSDSKNYRPSLRLKYAGPIFAKLFGNIPDNVRSFLETDKPKIYVAMTSGKTKNLRLVYNTLSKMDVRSVFCSLVHSETFQSTENILVVDYLPSHLVMPLCDLAIIHGGQGSVQTAIASGTPLIGFPIQPEQNFNLKQVERHGAGLCLSLRSLRKGYLHDAIYRILKDKRYKASMEQLKTWESRRDGALEVAKAVRELIGNHDREK